jgi:hypothetical protein
MACRMATIAKRDQIRRLVASANGARYEMVNIQARRNLFASAVAAAEPVTLEHRAAKLRLYQSHSTSTRQAPLAVELSPMRPPYLAESLLALRTK